MAQSIFVSRQEFDTLMDKMREHIRMSGKGRNPLLLPHSFVFPKPGFVDLDKENDASVAQTAWDAYCVRRSLFVSERLATEIREGAKMAIAARAAPLGQRSLDQLRSAWGMPNWATLLGDS